MVISLTSVLPVTAASVLDPTEFDNRFWGKIPTGKRQTSWIWKKQGREGEFSSSKKQPSWQVRVGLGSGIFQIQVQCHLQTKVCIKSFRFSF